MSRKRIDRNATPGEKKKPKGMRAGEGMSERELRSAVTKFLGKRGWRWSYCTNSRYTKGMRGVPDILCVKADRLLFVECKTEFGKVTNDQQDWLNSLRLAGAWAVVIRPDDLEGFFEALDGV